MCLIGGQVSLPLQPDVQAALGVDQDRYYAGISNLRITACDSDTEISSLNGPATSYGPGKSGFIFTYHAPVANMEFLGPGRVEIDHLALYARGASSKAILFDSAATMNIHDNIFSGNGAVEKVRGPVSYSHGIQLGGTGWPYCYLYNNSRFGGYGTVIDDNLFEGLRSAVDLYSAANGVVITRNNILNGGDLKSDTSSKGAPFVIDGKGNADPKACYIQNMCLQGTRNDSTKTCSCTSAISNGIDGGNNGNIIANNLIQAEAYRYDFYLDHTGNNTFIANNSYDETSEHLAMFDLSAGTVGNNIITTGIYYQNFLSYPIKPFIRTYLYGAKEHASYRGVNYYTYAKPPIGTPPTNPAYWRVMSGRGPFECSDAVTACTSGSICPDGSHCNDGSRRPVVHNGTQSWNGKQTIIDMFPDPPKWDEGTGGFPPCDATQRGQHHFEFAPSGLPDLEQVCAKNADNSFSWKPTLPQHLGPELYRVTPYSDGHWHLDSTMSAATDGSGNSTVTISSPDAPSRGYIVNLGSNVKKGHSYNVTYTVNSAKSGIVSLAVGGSATSWRSATGTYSEVIVAKRDDGVLYIQAGVKHSNPEAAEGFEGVLSSKISVKEALPGL
jgi:hypothetical protein